MEHGVRHASHAGNWYTEDGNKLKNEIKEYLDSAEKGLENKQNLKSLIVPHAGYRYSGPVAAWAYVNVNPEKFKRVIILGPSHHAYIPGLGLPAVKTYQTPLGNISLDTEGINKLLSNEDFFEIANEQDEFEHSIEMQLPFLKYIFGEKDFLLIPIIVGYSTLDQHRTFAKQLLEYYLDPETLFVISSDFCHWGNRFKFTFHDETKFSHIYESIEYMDRLGMDCIECKDLEKFNKYVNETKNTICGRRPISILLAIIEEATDLKDKNDIRFVKYAQSSKVTDMSESSVSYATAINIIG